MKYFIFIVSLLFGSIVNGQTAKELNSSQILQALKKLNTVGSVLYLAAHPDDENTRLISYLVNEKHLRTGYLALTRGDGGQNLIGKEQGAALGLIRTQELLAARRTDGAMQFFTRANDFGYSKSPEETFNIWNKDSILADIVWTIRRFKPDVIILRFPTTGEGGHGHHTASAILALEAFDMAGDSSQFPEQLKYTDVWQAKRIFWNTFKFGSFNTTSSNQLQIDVGGYNALLGKSYGEIAASSRSMHKSQGFGVAKQRGEKIEFFKLLKGDRQPEKSLFEGISTSWSRFSNTSKIETLIASCIANFDAQHPEKSIPVLVRIYKEIQAINEVNATIKYWKFIKLKMCENLIVQCAGLWMEAYPKDYCAVPGSEVEIKSQIIVRNNIDVTLNSIEYFNQVKIKTNKILSFNQMETFTQIQKLNNTTPYSNPYWLVEPHTVGMYKVENQHLIGKPENAPAKSVIFNLTVAGLPLHIKRGISYKFTDPVLGEAYRPFEILPPATVNISSGVWVFSSTSSKKINFTVKANKDNINGRLEVAIPKGWTIKIPQADFHIAKKGDEIHIEALLNPSENGKDGILKAQLIIDGKHYNKSITRIEYNHIPYQFFLSDATAKIVHLNLKKSENKIGYIPGAGDKVAQCLQQIGYDVSVLNNSAIAKLDLSQFDCIVTGVRAFNTNDRLKIYHDKLMEYVKRGGNLIVQYNTNNRHAPLTMQLGPYPFTISRERVTDEEAEVKFIDSEAQVLNFPNKITQKDFEGWVQERGTYFASSIDKRYKTIFAMHDIGEKDMEGSLIIGKYGEGHFVYTGLVFFRELPAGVPGAYRLFVNILEL